MNREGVFCKKKIPEKPVGFFCDKSLRRHYPYQVMWVCSQPAAHFIEKYCKHPLYSVYKGTQK